VICLGLIEYLCRRRIRLWRRTPDKECRITKLSGTLKNSRRTGAAHSTCHGPWTLASANVIKNRHLTSFWHDGVPEDIKAAGGVWEDEEVVVDGNLITSRWPMDLPAFMRETMKKLD